MITLATDDPMGLTEEQAVVLELYSRTGDVNDVARELGMGRAAVGMQLTRACRRARVANSVLLVVKWAEFKAGRAAT